MKGSNLMNFTPFRGAKYANDCVNGRPSTPKEFHTNWRQFVRNWEFLEDEKAWCLISFRWCDYLQCLFRAGRDIGYPEFLTHNKSLPTLRLIDFHTISGGEEIHTMFTFNRHPQHSSLDSIHQHWELCLTAINLCQQ